MYVSGKFDSWQLMMVVLFLKVLEGTQQRFARGGSPPSSLHFSAHPLRVCQHIHVG